MCDNNTSSNIEFVILDFMMDRLGCIIREPVLLEMRYSNITTQYATFNV